MKGYLAWDAELYFANRRRNNTAEPAGGFCDILAKARAKTNVVRVDQKDSFLKYLELLSFANLYTSLFIKGWQVNKVTYIRKISK